ncbi:MAG: tetratricopeptide repeat protein [Candidatus Manganitrophaceae bacterium]
MTIHPYKNLLLLSLFLCGIVIVWGINRIPLPSARQNEPEKNGPEQYQSLKMDELKRQFRLPDRQAKPADSPLSPLFSLYDQNRFQELSGQITTLSAPQKNGAIHLLYGNALVFLGKQEEAVAAYEQAYRTTDLPEEQAAAMANFGLLFSMRGAWKEGITWIERALILDRKMGDRRAEAADLSILGTLYYQSGDGTKGSETHLEALKIAESIGDRWLVARQLTSIGNLYYLDHSYETALTYQQRALRLHREIGNHLGEAVTLTSLGFIHKELKEFDKALDYHSNALSLHRGWNDLPAQANDLVNLALIYQDQGEMEKAIGSAQEGLKIREGMADLAGMANIEGTIGTIYQDFGNLPEAIRHLEKSKELFQKGGASQQIHIVDQRIQTLRDRIQN